MRSVLSLAVIAIILGLGWFWVSGGFDRLALWAAGEQREFQNVIARALRAARAGEAGAVMTLLGACFAYGLVHAAGPGHGKVLIGGYGFARKVAMFRLAAIALVASLGQAVTAVAMVYFGVLVLNLGRRAMVDTTEAIMAPMSYGAIALIGLWLVWRGARKLWVPAHHHDHDHAHEGDSAACSSCGHVHGPTLDQVENAGSLREVFALIIGIAIRPCTGALFVLIITWQMGIGGLGVAGAFAMAIGTALITIFVGLAAAGLRGGVLAGIAGSPQMGRVMAGMEILAGTVVIILASGLLLRAI
ncbi:MAG: hypothetical protein ABJL67_19290 [Sulfitobacter sp.]